MPIYEYYCSDCNNVFETLRPMSKADDPISCDTCQGKNTSRMISVVYAHSDGRIVSGGNTSCSACSTNTCSTCGVRSN